MLTPAFSVASLGLAASRVVYSDGVSLLSSSALAYAASGTHLLATASADASIPFAVQAFSGTQSGNLFESRDSSGNVKGRVTSAGAFSFAAQTNSEQFGAGASCSGIESVAIGAAAASQANSPTGRGTAIGYGATISGTGSGDSVAIGWSASCSGGRFGTAVGANATASASQATVVGNQSTASGSSAVVIGPSVTCNQANGIVVGGSNSHTAANGVIVGAGHAVSGAGAISLGFGGTVTHEGSVCAGNGLSSSRNRELVLGAAAANGLGASTIGHRIRIAATTSTNTLRDLALIDATWPTSTDASRIGQLALWAYDSTAAREGLRVGTNGSNATIGFLGATAVARQTFAAAATDLATVITLANSLRTAGINLGLGA